VKSPPVAIVFDCDGVLVDSEPHSVAAWLDVVDRLGHPATATDIDACVGLGFEPTHAALQSLGKLPAADVLWPDLLAALSRSFEQGLQRFEDAVGVLGAAIDVGIPVAVASASPRQRLDLTLESADLAHRFGVSVAGDEVAFSKPDPAVYLKAVSELGVQVEGVIAIEDTGTGATAALRAGMQVVGVARNAAARVSLYQAGASVVERLTPAMLGL
jgi:beta-phosphoglucomutase-like phosphatase (HAD superfamily)